jgi:hypothetical protein
MGEVGEAWREWNEESRQHRHSKQDIAKDIVLEWAEKNKVTFSAIQVWHFRLTKGRVIIDIYPQKDKFHNVKTNVRGKYAEVISFLEKEFKHELLGKTDT